MKLSEKLAQAERADNDEKAGTDARSDRAPAPGRSGSAGAGRGSTGTPSSGMTPRRRPEPAAEAPSGRGKDRSRDTKWAESKRKVRTMVLEEVAPKMGTLVGDELADEVKRVLEEVLRREDLAITPLERRKFVDEVIQDTLGYGPLDPMLADPSITEIMCNRYDDIWVERDGRLLHTDAAFNDEAQYKQIIDKIVSAVGRRVDEGSPMVDARLADGSRVNAIIPPLAIHGAVLTIRKFAADPYTVHDLINFGTFTIDLARVLEACVLGKLNILVSGGTGTGKTTNLNVLSSFIPMSERIITIEDAAELQLQQPHVINLEARPANAEGSGQVAIRDLVRNALRMRPDRIIVGECRGGEALDMLQAMNTGHEGSLTTVHSNGPRDGLSRLETMVLMAGFDLPVRAIREQIASAIDVIMHLDRLPDGRRVVTSLTEVQGMEGDTLLLQPIFEFKFRPNSDPAKPQGELRATGLRPKFAEKLKELRIDLPAGVFRAPEVPAPPSGRRPDVRRTKPPRPADIAARERRR